MNFRLYIAGHAHNSVQALANFTALCRESLPDQKVNTESGEIQTRSIRATPAGRGSAPWG